MSLTAYKQPKSKSEDNYVGIELEFSTPVKSSAKMEKLIGKHKLRKYSQLGFDGNPTKEGESSFELKLLLKQDELENIIPQVGKLLKEAEASVNHSHGMHVHLDMRNRSAKIAFNNLAKCQDVLFSIADKSRRNNTYCEKQLEDNLDQVSEDHYAAINPVLSSEKYTIEVRIREGLVDDEAILNWCKLLVSICDTRMIEKKIPTLTSLQKVIQLNKEMKSHFNKTIKEHKDDSVMFSPFNDNYGDIGW